MKFKVKDLSKCHGKIVALLSEMYQYSGKVLEFHPDRYNRTGIFMYDDWFFEVDWLEPVEEVASPTEEPSTESRPEQGIKLITEPRWEGKEVHIESPYDVVNKPIHYHFSEFEPIKVIQAWDLSFALGNVVKYIARAGRKDSSKLIEDLEKAKKYLEFEIEHLRKK